MKKAHLVFLLIYTTLFSNAQSINQLLGYTEDDVLLIVHSDDLAAAHSENAASFEAMKNGIVNSGSIIVPGPWFTEVIREYKKNAHFDLGIHLALTSEWRDYKWGPVSSLYKVKSLVNKNGYFYSCVDSLVMYAKLNEIELELDNQIKKCINAGLDITHLDSHMGWAFSNAKYHDIYVKLSQKYKLPILYRQGTSALLKEANMKYNYGLNTIVGAAPNHYPDSMAIFYTQILQSIQPGIHEIIVHTGYDDDEMRAICVDHPLWGSLWRQKDFNFVTSQKAKDIIRLRGIKRVTWREIRDKVIRKS